MSFKGIAFPFRGVPVKNGGGRPHFLDGIAKIDWIARINPDWRGEEKWSVRCAKVAHAGDYAPMPDEFWPQLEAHLRRHHGPEIEEKLNRADQANKGKWVHA